MPACKRGMLCHELSCLTAVVCYSIDTHSHFLSCCCCRHRCGGWYLCYAAGILGAISTPLLLNFVASEGGATVAHLIAEGAKLEEPNVTAAAKEEASAESTAEAPATPTPAEAPAAADTRPTTAAGAPGAPPGGEATTKAPSSEAERPNTLPLRRLGEPEDIASAVVWLCMQGHYVTGTDLLIDGGSMCRVTPS